MTRFVLDACAVIAFLFAEDGCDVVESILQQATNTMAELFMHEINRLEIYYGVYRENGEEAARKTLEKIDDLPIQIIRGLDDQIFHEAGRLKASYRISLADSIAAACAKVKTCPLVTADHHELDPLDEEGVLEFLWIR